MAELGGHLLRSGGVVPQVGRAGLVGQILDIFQKLLHLGYLLDRGVRCAEGAEFCGKVDRCHDQLAYSSSLARAVLVTEMPMPPGTRKLMNIGCTTASRLTSAVRPSPEPLAEASTIPSSPTGTGC